MVIHKNVQTIVKTNWNANRKSASVELAFGSRAISVESAEKEMKWKKNEKINIFPIRIRPEEMLTIKLYNSCGTKREKQNIEIIKWIRTEGLGPRTQRNRMYRVNCFHILLSTPITTSTFR